MDRRDALKLLSALPLIGALKLDRVGVDRAMRKVEAMVAGGETAPMLFFTPHEAATVRILVDLIIPKDEHSGSATDAKVPEFMDAFLADKHTSEGSRNETRGGLRWLDAECTRRFGHTFVQCTATERTAVLDDIAWAKKAKPEMSQGVAFFNSFRDFTATGFFSSPMGWKDVKYIGNTFNPNWNGCPPEALAKLGVSYHDEATKKQ